MLTKKTLSTLALGMILTSGAVMAAPLQESLNVNVTAHIPTDAFYVSPNNWDASLPLAMQYSPATGKFAPLVRSINMKSTVGAITAKLAHTPSISSAEGDIGLTIKLADKPLSSTSTAIANVSEAKATKTANLVISAAAPDAKGYKPGDYQGQVSILFESEAE